MNSTNEISFLEISQSPSGVRNEHLRLPTTNYDFDLRPTTYDYRLPTTTTTSYRRLPIIDYDLRPTTTNCRLRPKIYDYRLAITDYDYDPRPTTTDYRLRVRHENYDYRLPITITTKDLRFIIVCEIRKQLSKALSHF